MKLSRILAGALAVATLSVAAVAAPAHALFNEPLPVGSWNLVSAPTGTSIPAGVTPTLELTETAGALRVHGTSGCNSFFGTAQRSGDVMMHTSRLGSTLMGCLPEQRRFERSYIEALSDKTVGFHVRGRNLELVIEGASWNYARRPGTAAVAPELVGTWKLDGAASTVRNVANAKATLEISADGSYSGQAPCNFYFGQVHSDSAEVSFATPGATRRSCGIALSVQETAYFQAFPAIIKWTRVGNKLTLTTPGRSTLVFVR